MENKKNSITILFIVGLLVVYYFFPTNDIFQKIVTQFAFFIVLPILFTVFILKEKLDTLSWNTTAPKEALRWVIFSLLVGFLVYVIVYNIFTPEILLLIPKSIRANFGMYLVYEFMLTPLFVLSVSFFLYGFLISRFRRQLGYGSIMAPVVLMFTLLLAQGFQWAQLVYLIFTPLAAFVAYKTKSIWFAVISQIVYVFTIDTVIVLLVR